MTAVKQAFRSAETVVTHYPTASKHSSAESLDVAGYEELLGRWFGRPVVLLGSGRAGIGLYLKAKGLNRYRDYVLMPRFISRCVMEAVVSYAFPVEAAPTSGCSATLIYHQYGFPNAANLEGAVLEDICHQFFAGAGTGARRWTGEAAVFSIPKFFAISGMAGGLVIERGELADRIGEMRDRPETLDDELRVWMRQVIRENYGDPGASESSAALKAAYALLLDSVQPDTRDLAGFPATLSGLEAVGLRRQRNIVHLMEALGPKSAPPGFLSAARRWLPFAFPYFGSGDVDRLMRADRALLEAKIHAGVYRVDVACNMLAADYRPCILLPCHQDLSEDQIQTMGRIIRRSDA